MFQDVSKKLIYIFLPFLLVTIGFLALYTFFHWYCILENQWFTLDEEMLTIWLPAILVSLPVLFWLTPKIRLLKINGHMIYYQMAIIFFVLILNGNLQYYIFKSTNHLIEIEDIAEMANAEDSKYYQVGSFEIEPRLSKYFVDVNYNDDDFTVSVYFVSPMFSIHKHPKLSLYKKAIVEKMGQNDIQFNDSLMIRTLLSESDYLKSKYWYGTKFKESFGKNNDATNQRNIRKFLKDTEVEFKTYDFKKINYLERQDNSSVSGRNFQQTLNKVGKELPVDAVILYGIHNDFEERLSGYKEWFIWTAIIGLFIFVLLFFYPSLDQDSYKLNRKGESLESEDADFLKETLLPNRELFITQMFLYLSVLMFLVMAFNHVHVVYPSAQSIIPYGSNYSPLVRQGEYWRLITALFINAGLWQMCINLTLFVMMGTWLESILGQLKFLLLILVIGLISFLLSDYWDLSAHSVGLSGVTFGIFGWALILINDKSINTDNSFLVFGALFIVIHIINGLTEIDNIYNKLHLVGFSIGAILGLFQYTLNRFAAR